MKGLGGKFCKKKPSSSLVAEWMTLFGVNLPTMKLLEERKVIFGFEEIESLSIAKETGEKGTKRSM